MCMGTNIMAKIEEAALKKSPVMKLINEKTGYRPYGVSGMMDDLGIRDRAKNPWREPGAKGNPDGDKPNTYNTHAQPAHARSIAARRATGGR